MLCYLIYGYLLTHTTHSGPRQTCLGLAATAGVAAMPGVERRSIGIQNGKRYGKLIFFISKLPMIYLWLVIFIPNFIVIYYSTVHLYSTLLVIYQISKFHSTFHRTICCYTKFITKYCCHTKFHSNLLFTISTNEITILLYRCEYIVIYYSTVHKYIYIYIHKWINSVWILGNLIVFEYIYIYIHVFIVTRSGEILDVSELCLIVVNELL